MTDQELNALFAEWASWCRSKRLFAPSPHPRSILGTMRLPSAAPEPRDRELSAELARLHLAIMAGGERSEIIIAHYLLGPYSKFHVGDDTEGRPIYKRRLRKQMARAAGIAPAAWSRSVRRACRDAYERMTRTARLDDAEPVARYSFDPVEYSGKIPEQPATSGN